MTSLSATAGAQAGAPAVHASHVGKSFGDRVVLHDIDLAIQPGEVLSLIGPSGAGKSTMLRCLTLLDRFDTGTLSYGDLSVCQAEGTAGKSVYDKKAVKEARMRFGIVFQSYNLFPHRTVLQNITDAPIRVQKRQRDEVGEQALRLLDELGLSDHADKVPCELSGGQQQRVAIARALCMNPQIIYFDEATSALDPKLTADMHALIRRLAKGGMAIGIVTHEMGFARDASDRIAFLFDGYIVEEGPADQIIDHPQDERTRAFLSRSTD